MKEYEIITNYLLSNIIFTTDTLSPDQQLIETLLIDSISIVKVILFLENTFNIVFEDTDLEPKNFETVNNMVELVKRKKEGR